jgi:hypothetical protein
LSLELGDNSSFQRGCAADRGVFGKAFVDGAYGRILDVLRCVKIRFTGAQPNDIFSFGFQLGRAGGNSKGRGGLDGLYASREFQDIS